MGKKLSIIILAAGQGKRLGGKTQKVVKELFNKPMLLYILETVKKLFPEKIAVVVGYKKEEVFKQLKNEQVEYAEQPVPRGTGDAVLKTEKIFDGYNGDVLILYGDVPFISYETLNSLYKRYKENTASCVVLSSVMDEPAGYGRIRRNATGNVEKIVEDVNASEEEKKIKEVNAGVYIFSAPDLFRALKKVTPDSVKGEYYLTDVIEILSSMNKKVLSLKTDTPEETMGVNTFEDIKKAEFYIQKGAENE
jgi:bifunctional UDP-N-acetylglucosamine pyrophosphorylase / glucosamine-1-phosphate N-acetyltransferase